MRRAQEKLDAAFPEDALHSKKAEAEEKSVIIDEKIKSLLALVPYSLSVCSCFRLKLPARKEESPTPKSILIKSSFCKQNLRNSKT